MTEYAQTPRTTPSRHTERATYERAVAHQLLDEAYVCDLGFVVDGAPRVLPTLFVRVDDTVYLHASTAATWMLAARGDGIPACVTVTALDGLVLARSQFNHSANYRSLVAHGTATLVSDPDAKRDAMTALVEKVGPGRSEHTRPPTAAELAKTAVLALPLDEVSVKRRSGGVIDDEDDLALPYWAGVVPLTTTFGYGEPEPGVHVPAPDYVRTRSPYLEAATMRGEHVVLEPLCLDDAAELFAALDDEEVYRYMSVKGRRPSDVHGMTLIIEDALQAAAGGERVPWIIRDARTGAPVGTTSYYGISEFNETVAIGHTQVARDRWRSAVNTEAKLLLMTRAFETLGAGRVEWHTDDRNERSQAAIARLGAHREGVLRRHKRRADGTWRDTVQYAMTIDDWPAAKKRLVERLAAGNTV
jgi:RimJ/RimL family protein N-acetyltransferase/nitroimidazol reductase NimA-like FMN-containing flavoprotein (pyridoxamine 5'-phosphate oxidase superfamily)